MHTAHGTVEMREIMKTGCWKSKCNRLDEWNWWNLYACAFACNGNCCCTSNVICVLYVWAWCARSKFEIFTFFHLAFVQSKIFQNFVMIFSRAISNIGLHHVKVDIQQNLYISIILMLDVHWDWTFSSFIECVYFWPIE